MNGNTFRPCWECLAELPFCLERPFKHRFPDLSAHFFVLAGPSLSVFVPLGIPRASQEIATTVAMRLSTRHSAELLSCDSDFDSGCDVL
jgi:hypothetical protein